MAKLNLRAVVSVGVLLLLPLNVCADDAEVRKPGPQTFEELPPETQQKYKEAQERLRKAKIALTIAQRQAEAADPALWAAHKLQRAAEAEGHDFDAPLRTYENQYRERGEEAHKAFKEWSECVQRQAMVQRMGEMVDDDDERPLLVYLLRGMVHSLFSQGLPPEAEAISKAKPEEWTEEQLLALWKWISKRPPAPRFGDDIACDCEKLGKPVKPTVEMMIAAWNVGRSATRMRDIGALYISENTPKSIKEARRLVSYDELDKIWPNWREHETKVWREQEKETSHDRRFERFLEENMPSLLKGDRKPK